ncbi:hypothetical protein CPB85DRAFT_684029 [Mucidula mucida]|nr:hypothetical protein CPB85DRAFT_684029 [Mucidula mucida]
MCLLHFELHGHKSIPLIGGATGRVGDPSGRTKERSPADIRQVEHNVLQLTDGVKQFFRGASAYASKRGFSPIRDDIDVKSNLSWYENFKLLDFLQQVGVHARVNTMLARESVRSRLESNQGMSFTEFTYQLLQGYDFYYLNKHHGCRIQVGGSDQWGNIVAGVEFIRSLNASLQTPTPEPFGVTTPLLTTSSGAKFGKSAGNAVWLKPDLTSIFDFYQYFVKVEDADVKTLLKAFTLLPLSNIDEIVQEHEARPEKRSAQKLLAAEVTELIHGKETVEQAVAKTEALFSSRRDRFKGMDANTILKTFEGDQRLHYCDEESIFSTPVGKLASRYGLVTSNSAARQLIQAQGLYLNDTIVPDSQHLASRDALLDGRVMVLRAGKDKIIVLAISA